MLQNPATKSPFTVVPGYSRLFRRGATYYFRVGVPKELRKAIGKTEIIKSLRTTNFGEAKRLIAFESADADARFKSERRKLNGADVSRINLPALSDAEIHRLVVEWFIGIEKASESWWATSGVLLDDDERAKMLDNVRNDAAVYDGGTSSYGGRDGKGDVDSFLAERGIDCPEDTPAYLQLCEVFRRGRLENLRRIMSRLTEMPYESHDLLLKGIGAYSEPLKVVGKSETLGEFLDRFLKYIQQNRSETTFITYQTPVRIMREILGERTLVAAITRQDVERLCESLKQRPKNAEQKYRGLSSQEAIEEAARRGDKEKLAPKSLENYYRNILAIFNFAKDEGLRSDNPAKHRAIQEQFRYGKKKRKKKAKFTPEELIAIFHAPIFTGCIDDERNFSKVGANQPRRGRFWVPLLGLLQGLRCNEACQLYTEDVKEADGIPYLAVRTELDDEELTDKRLKNISSIRSVPIHPMLLQIGFLEFVADRRRDKTSNRLFPELPPGHTGRYSNPFSKWFRRFLDRACETKPKGTFHSFRHHFRDALRLPGISDENVEALGGWAGEDEEQRHYGYGPTLKALLADISRVNYETLDLSHLYPTAMQLVAEDSPCRTRTRTLPVPPLQRTIE